MRFAFFIAEGIGLLETPGRKKISRIALSGGAIFFAEPPSPIIVVNQVGDFIFRDVMLDKPKDDIMDHLRLEFPTLSEKAFGDYVDNAIDAYVHVMAKAEDSARDRDELNALFGRQSWRFRKFINVGVTGAWLEIGCDHFNNLFLSHYAPAFADLADEHLVLAHIQVAVAPDGRDYWLRCDHSDIYGPFDHHQAYLEIQRHLLSRAHAPRRTGLILHAGAVVDEDTDTSIILAGESGSGKSSIAAELLLQGKTLVADDTAIIDADTGEIWWQKLPLRLKEGSWGRLRGRIADAGWCHEEIVEEEELRVWRVHPERSASKTGSFGPRRCIMIFPIYEAGAVTDVEEIQTLTAMGLITEAGAWFDTSEGSMRRTIDWLSSIPCYSMIFSSADDAVAAIRGLSANA